MMSAPDDEDPFQRVGVEKRYDLDLDDVRGRVLRLSVKLHPDRAPDPVRADANAAALAAVNQAAITLESDERRAEALLECFGGPVAAADRTLPDGFLESMLATRMELEEALASGDAAGHAALEAWAQERRAEHEARVRSLFGSGGMVPDQATRVQIRRELNEWRYIERMLGQLDPDSIADGGLA